MNERNEEALRVVLQRLLDGDCGDERYLAVSNG